MDILALYVISRVITTLACGSAILQIAETMSSKTPFSIPEIKFDEGIDEVPQNHPQRKKGAVAELSHSAAAPFSL